MLIEHRGKRPRIHESAYIAPTATVCGDVTLGEECRVLFGAIITAEGGPVTIGRQCVVMEHAVIRGTRSHPVQIGKHVLVGPRAYLSGCTVEDDVFLATGATIFNGARIGTRAEVRINGIVHLKTVLPPDTLVPIDWIAVGDPAQILPPSEHQRIWAIQQPLNFPLEVWGVERSTDGTSIMPRIMERYTRALERHRDDTILDGE